MAPPGSKSQRKGKQAALRVELVPDATVLIETRILASEQKLRIKSIANLIMHDPVMMLEFLQFSNSVLYAGAGGEIYSAETAIARLGTKRLLETLRELNRRKPVDCEDTWKWTEMMRYHCRRVSIVAMIIAGATHPHLTDQARAAGLFCDLGHMLAVACMGKDYWEMAEKVGKKKLAYYLGREQNFHLDEVLVDYLRAKGIPETLVLPHDRMKECPTATDSSLRFLVQGAQEVVEAYDAGKFEKYEPPKPLPSGSALRLLKVRAVQQERIYISVERYLQRVEIEEAPEGSNMLIASYHEEEERPRPEEEEKKEDLNASRYGPPPVALDIPAYAAQPVRPKSRERLQELYDICDTAEGEADLSEKVVEFLTDKGLFRRSAVIRVIPSRREAIISWCSGPELNAGDHIHYNDPLSPFELFTLQIQSFAAKRAQASAPFGAAAYAIGPLRDVESGDTVLLYVDTGDEPLTMEARKVFRLVLGLMAKTIEIIRSE